ncbi:MAG: hypothetical protein LC126_05885 [Bryobacterales bacterium]|nr:hypothetical protein [Bryobacterales bacterium]
MPEISSMRGRCLAMHWLVWIGVLPALPAQGPGLVVSAGYSAPQPVRVSPGQVITLFVHANGTQPAEAEAAKDLPLPVTLNGYTVTMRQTFQTGSAAVPLFAVYPVENCYGLAPSACSELVAITLQVPWELAPNVDSARRPENFAVLTVAYQGVDGEAFPLEAVTDSIHIVNSCDATMPPGVQRPEDLTGPCKPVVTHADGRLVTAGNPAKSGEALTMYAVGLGRPEGNVKTGDAAAAAVALPDVKLGFEYGVNRPASEPAAGGAAPIFAGLVAGQVGLYQVTFTAPAASGSVRGCTASTIRSNLTVSIGRQSSFDGAGICVDSGN